MSDGPIGEKELARLERKVFLWPDCKERDRHRLKVAIQKFVMNDPGYGFYKMLWDAVHEVNDGGQTCKYLYFNERIQRFFLDRHFEAWAKAISELTSIELEKIA
jgi:hypothetical protein